MKNYQVTLQDKEIQMYKKITREMLLNWLGEETDLEETLLDIVNGNWDIKLFNREVFDYNVDLASH